MNKKSLLPQNAHGSPNFVKAACTISLSVLLSVSSGFVVLGIHGWQLTGIDTEHDSPMNRNWNLQMGQVMRKRVLCHMRTTKVQINLRISTFVVRCLDGMIGILAISKVSRF